MSTSPYLKMTLLTVGQATPETTVNDALSRIENSSNRKLDVTMSGGGAVVLTADQITTYTLFNLVGATAACSLTIPLTVDGNLTPINRQFIVRNPGSFDCLVTSTGGADVTVVAGGSALLFCDGTDIIALVQGGALTDVSGDTNPFLGGDLGINIHNITSTGDWAILNSTATGGSSSIRFSATGAVKVAISGATTIVGTLGVCGATSLGALTVSGNLTVVTLSALQNVVTDGSKVLISEAAIYDISPFFGGQPTISGGLMGRMVMGRNVVLASGAVGWQAYAGTPATDATATIDIRKNNVSVGSIVFASGSNTGTYTFNDAVSLSAGDRLEFFAPATQDSALADISLFIKGTRTLP